jgi:hypothetical protein
MRIDKQSIGAGWLFAIAVIVLALSAGSAKGATRGLEPCADSALKAPACLPHR